MSELITHIAVLEAPALDKARQGGGYARALLETIEALRKLPPLLVFRELEEI